MKFQVQYHVNAANICQTYIACCSYVLDESISLRIWKPQNFSVVQCRNTF